MGKVISVSKSPVHGFSKNPATRIHLLEGLGVDGDAHKGEKIKHRSRVRQNPDQPNLRQVHLIHKGLFDELKQSGFQLNPGDIGENITTENIDLLQLPKGSILRIGATAQVEITGLRNPCSQLNDFQDGLMKQLIYKDENGNITQNSQQKSEVFNM